MTTTPPTPSPRHILLEAAQDIQNQPHLWKPSAVFLHGEMGDKTYDPDCQCTCAGLAVFRAAERLAAPGATPEARSEAANAAISTLSHYLGLDDNVSPKTRGSDLAHAVFAWNDRPETTQESAVTALRTAAALT